MVAAGARTFMR